MLFSSLAEPDRAALSTHPQLVDCPFQSEMAATFFSFPQTQRQGKRLAFPCRFISPVMVQCPTLSPIAIFLFGSCFAVIHTPLIDSSRSDG
jgi:hypothetical protein